MTVRSHKGRGPNQPNREHVVTTVQWRVRTLGTRSWPRRGLLGLDLLALTAMVALASGFFTTNETQSLDVAWQTLSTLDLSLQPADDLLAHRGQ